MIAIPQLRMAKLISFMDDAAKPGGFDLLVCVLPLQSAHEAAGAAGTRHSPRPPWGREINANLGRIAPRDRDVMFGADTVIPGRCGASNPESRDSPMRNCASEVWSGACHRAAQSADPLGPSRNDQIKRRRIVMSLLTRS